MSLERRRQLVRIAREYDALIITDDVYDQLQWTVSPSSTSTLKEAVEPRIVDVDRFLDGGAERAGSDGFGNAISSGSFSKICAPGCRSGWAEGTKLMVNGVANAGSTNSGSAPSQLTAAFMSEMLVSGELENHLYTTLQPGYAKRYRLMIDAIQESLVPLGVRLPQASRTIVGGYFIWLSLPDPLDADEFTARAIEEEKVVVGQGSLFGVYGDMKDGELNREIRVCFAWAEEDLLREGIERLGRVIGRMKAGIAERSTQPPSKRKMADPRHQ
ncbi:hypothetical protein MMC19_007122 [Ptychographa xylographoides]|nr:hypothetical protein [Ptychographa xylographoides]